MFTICQNSQLLKYSKTYITYTTTIGRGGQLFVRFFLFGICYEKRGYIYHDMFKPLKIALLTY